MTSPSPQEFAKTVFARIISRRLYALRSKILRRTVTREKLLKYFHYGRNERNAFIENFKQSLRQRFFLSDLNKKEFYINLMTSLGGFDSIMDDADLVHENKFQALGSDLFSFGDKIDWHLDFKSGKRWPLSYYTKIDTLGLEDPSDIKIPWELSRFHQAIWLGRAYWISHSEAHADKFKSLVDSWIENNPVGYGVNWNMPMEVAIRAMNLIVGLLYFMGSNRIDDEFLVKLLCSLYEHGTFVRHNLERTLRSGNHYISDLVGLIYLGIFFYDTKVGKRWVKFAQRELELEILNQVYEDGTDYEKSTSYQRFVAELFAAAYVILRLNKFDISKDFSDRLEKMFDFIASATMRDGKVPSIGDSDDGRLFKLKSEVDPNCHRDLLSVGAVLFDRGNLKSVAGEYSDLALLLLGTEGFEKFSSLQDDLEVKSAVFPKGGFAFLKTARDFCSFDIGDIGKRGRGGHGHDDVLSITIAGKNPFLVDRGTYCYTCDTKLRNKLRSTYSHNTAVIDRTEQAEFSGLWSIKKDLTSPELLNWTSTTEQDVILAQHHAYERLPQPVVHKRKITFNKRQRTFLLEDSFIGKGKHEIELMFHFAPELKVVDVGRNFIALEGEEFALMKFQSVREGRMDFTLEDWEHSPSYGVLQNAKSARLKAKTDIPMKFETFVFILDNLDDINHILNRIRRI